MADPVGSKPGWKTTEFWMTVVSQISTVVGVFQGSISPKYAAIISASLTGIYGLIRAFTKANVGDSQPTNPVNALPSAASPQTVVEVKK